MKLDSAYACGKVYVCHTSEYLSCGTAYPQAPVSSIGGACDGRVSLLHEPSSHGSTGKCRPAAASTSPAHAPSAAATALSTQRANA